MPSSKASPQKKQPEKKIRLGQTTATIWLQDGEKPFRTVDLQRSFQDNGEWRSNSTFSLAQLPSAIEALKLALAYVAEQEATV